MIRMEKEEKLNFSELSGRSITLAIGNSYVSGKDLVLGLADSLDFLKTVPDEFVVLSDGSIVREVPRLDQRERYPEPFPVIISIIAALLADA
jgi:hypothetical protein